MNNVLKSGHNEGFNSLVIYVPETTFWYVMNSESILSKIIASAKKRVPAVRVVVEVEGFGVVSHQYLWGVWIGRKLCSHCVII